MASIVMCLLGLTLIAFLSLGRTCYRRLWTGYRCTDHGGKRKCRGQSSRPVPGCANCESVVPIVSRETQHLQIRLLSRSKHASGQDIHPVSATCYRCPCCQLVSLPATPLLPQLLISRILFCIGCCNCNINTPVSQLRCLCSRWGHLLGATGFTVPPLTS